MSNLFFRNPRLTILTICLILALSFVPSAYILSMCPCRKRCEERAEEPVSLKFQPAYSDMQPVGF